MTPLFQNKTSNKPNPNDRATNKIHQFSENFKNDSKYKECPKTPKISFQTATPPENTNKESSNSVNTDSNAIVYNEINKSFENKKSDSNICRDYESQKKDNQFNNFNYANNKSTENEKNLLDKKPVLQESKFGNVSQSINVNINPVKEKEINNIYPSFENINDETNSKYSNFFDLVEGKKIINIIQKIRNIDINIDNKNEIIMNLKLLLNESPLIKDFEREGQNLF